MSFLGRKHSVETRNKIRVTHLNLKDKHPRWKGDKVGHAIHTYIRNRKPKPDYCESCGKITEKLDLANISQHYKRDLDDWEWLCRKCHMIKDGRLKVLISKSNNGFGKKRSLELKRNQSRNMIGNKRWINTKRDQFGRFTTTLEDIT